MSLNNQFITMGLMIGSGLGLGFFFDIYRVLTGKLNLKRWVIAILDIVYGMVAAAAVFRVLYYSNFGQLRFFIFFALLLGIYIYYQWFSRKVIRILIWIMDCIQWGWKVIVVRPIQLFYKILSIFFGFFKALTIFFYKTMLQLTYPMQFLMRRLIKLIQRILHLS